MKVFITGITGFIGGRLARYLAAGGYEVAGLARLTSRPEADLPVRLYRGSLTDAEAVRWAVRDFQPEAVCHLGALTSVAYSFDHPHEVVDTNLMGTINLAEACRREVRELKRFIFASSMEVYGEHPGRSDQGSLEWGIPFEETDEAKPSCPYAVAKLGAEKYLAYLGQAYKFPWLALRQTNCYGRAHDDRFIVEALVSQMLRGGAVTAGDPRPVRNFIHVDDLLWLYHRLLTAPFSQIAGEVYNVGPANGITIGELASRCADAVGWRGQVQWNRLPPRPGEVFYLNSTGDKLAGRLGWRPEVVLDKGLRRVILVRGEVNLVEVR